MAMQRRSCDVGEEGFVALEAVDAAVGPGQSDTLLFLTVWELLSRLDRDSRIAVAWHKLTASNKYGVVDVRPWRQRVLEKNTCIGAYDMVVGLGARTSSHEVTQAETFYARRTEFADRMRRDSTCNL